MVGSVYEKMSSSIFDPFDLWLPCRAMILYAEQHLYRLHTQDRTAIRSAIGENIENTFVSEGNNLTVLKTFREQDPNTWFCRRYRYICLEVIPFKGKVTVSVNGIAMKRLSEKLTEINYHPKRDITLTQSLIDSLNAFALINATSFIFSSGLSYDLDYSVDTSEIVSITDGAKLIVTVSPKSSYGHSNSYRYGYDNCSNYTCETTGVVIIPIYLDCDMSDPSSHVAKVVAMRLVSITRMVLQAESRMLYNLECAN